MHPANPTVSKDLNEVKGLAVSQAEVQGFVMGEELALPADVPAFVSEVRSTVPEPARPGVAFAPASPVARSCSVD